MPEAVRPARVPRFDRPHQLSVRRAGSRTDPRGPRRPAVVNRLHAPTPALADRQSPRPMAKLASSPSRIFDGSPRRHRLQMAAFVGSVLATWGYPFLALAQRSTLVAAQACLLPDGSGDRPGTRGCGGRPARRPARPEVPRRELAGQTSGQSAPGHASGDSSLRVAAVRPT